MYQQADLVQYKSEKDSTMFPDENHEPYLDIIEHPKGRGFRFRYSCEGPSHGGIPGASSDKNKKTYPAVQIRNYSGYARIVVQLVTNEENPRLHPHSLVGKQCQNGICTVQCGPKDMTATFPNLGIQHVTKKNVASILEERYLAAEMQLSSLNEGLSLDVQKAIKEEDRQRIKAKALSEAKSIDLSVVRLMFIAYLPDSNGAFTLMLKPVISDAIFDSKSPNAATLKICRMDRTNGSASGMDEVYLLCDKVQKDDIQVRFYEEDQYGDEAWDAYGDFSPTDVHRQFAIVFRTPRYKDVNIKDPVTVQVQLRRRSDGEVSESRQFTYMPIKEDPEEISRKRRKVNSHFPDHMIGGQSNGNLVQSASGGSQRYGQSGFVFQPNSGGDNQNMKQQTYSSQLMKELHDETKSIANNKSLTNMIPVIHSSNDDATSGDIIHLPSSKENALPDHVTHRTSSSVLTTNGCPSNELNGDSANTTTGIVSPCSIGRDTSQQAHATKTLQSSQIVLALSKLLNSGGLVQHLTQGGKEYKTYDFRETAESQSHKRIVHSNSMAENRSLASATIPSIASGVMSGFHLHQLPKEQACDSSASLSSLKDTSRVTMIPGLSGPTDQVSETMGGLAETVEVLSHGKTATWDLDFKSARTPSDMGDLCSIQEFTTF